MARVCKEWFPKGYYKGQRGDGFYMDDVLKLQIDLLGKNIIHDWDFTSIRIGHHSIDISITKNR